MKRLLVLLIILATLVCICACKKTPKTNDPTQTTTIPTQTQPTNPTQTTTTPTQPTNPTQTTTTPTQPTTQQSTQPDDPRIAQMQALLEWPSENNFYNYALTSEYATPADVNLFNLFQNGFPDEPDDPTDQELVLLEGKMGDYWKEMDLARLPAEKMNAVLTQLFGITLEQTNGVGLDHLVYLEETNCYYSANTGVYYADITVHKVDVNDDGSLLVLFYAEYDGYYIVNLMPTDDGGYQILSNGKVCLESNFEG